ncbi:hypothetical protein VTN77DRAFT_7934 [Rasamsonia byssochlamydoides]|uniref:uncharacterized protein n=1 Tax=Rasamsonia byssochlamydoides TaxID=89139 RepID=UPI003741F0A9
MRYKESWKDSLSLSHSIVRFFDIKKSDENSVCHCFVCERKKTICLSSYAPLPSHSTFKSSQERASKRHESNMCSLYYIQYDCGCIIQEGDVVYCAARGSPDHGIRQKIRRREGYNCPEHGG